RALRTTPPTDWSYHNWYASYNRVTDKKWRFHEWDAEISLRDVNTDNTTRNEAGSPTAFHAKLMTSPEYKLKFNDAVQRLLTNGGLLTPARAGAVYQARVDDVNSAMVGESARWGDSHKEPPYTRANWRATQDGLQANYFPQRTS